MDIIETLEQDLGVPVIHPVPARCWEIQKRLHVNQPVKGYGRLLAEMIDG
jgi:maleate cis-trans isomerase